jgi:hypothetical protein
VEITESSCSICSTSPSILIEERGKRLFNLCYMHFKDFIENIVDIRKPKNYMFERPVDDYSIICHTVLDFKNNPVMDKYSQTISNTKCSICDNKIEEKDYIISVYKRVKFLNIHYECHERFIGKCQLFIDNNRDNLVSKSL